ncbi:MAG: phytanoyl-CoA dioxygenase family protein [candidate division Zixibacteria bacterium]|nr:phytanoyl-CoA dioxygenase family protein [candidate division Zixibacteria bacterium]
MTSAEIVKQYQEEGYVVIPDVIDEELVQEARGHIEWMGRKYPDIRPEQYHHYLIADDPFWLRLCADPRLMDVIEPFIGSDIALFGAHYISKPARTGQPVLWHQDGYYWPLEPMEVITIWLAVDDSTPENGCMRVIPRTHRDQRIFSHRVSQDIPNVLSSELDMRVVDADSAVDVVVPAGGVSLHDPYLIHGSEANLSDQRRCGLTLRYIPTTTRIKRENHAAYLCRGEKIEGINWYPEWPKFRPGDHHPFRGCDRTPWI